MRCTRQEPGSPRNPGNALPACQNPVPTYPGIDMERGLKLWEDLPTYLKFLQKFALRHAGSVALIEAGLRESGPPPLRALAHALAGSCANLGLDLCSLRAGRAEHLLVAGEEARTELRALQEALSTCLASIDRLQRDQTRQPEPVLARANLSGAERADVQSLLAQLLQALDQDSPEPVEPLLRTLATYLPQDQYADVAGHVDDFDFRAAEHSVQALATRLGLAIAGGTA